MYLSADSALLIAETKNQMECLANQPLSLGNRQDTAGVD